MRKSKEIAIFFGDSNQGKANAMLEEVVSVIEGGSVLPIMGIWQGNKEHSFMLLLLEEEYIKKKDKILEIMKKYEQQGIFVLEMGLGYVEYVEEEV